MSDEYLEVISTAARLHRQFLELVKLELDGFGIRDINNVQAMMLFNIGDAELTVSDLTSRGCYLGSNVSYNVKKMFENGYLVYQRSVHDRRSVRVRLTDTGRQLRDRLADMHRRPRCGAEAEFGTRSRSRNRGGDAASSGAVLDERTRSHAAGAASHDRAPGGGVGARGRSRSPAGLAGCVRRPRQAA